MTQLSGLKRSMPCEDLCSMMVPPSSASASMMTPQLIKDYDSDDASATSCIELASLLKLNSRILSSYNDQGDTFIDDVWDFQGIDVGTQSSSKRQKYSSSDTAALCPATEALTLVLEEAQVTLDKLMDMHIHRINPVEPLYQLQSLRLEHPFADQSVMNLTRLNGRTMV
jgi:hypothetical protein